MEENRKDQRIDYDPLSTLDLSLISVAGLMLVRSDRNLLPATQKKLRRTEAEVFRREKNRKYRYLLGEFDHGEEYRRNFLENRHVGFSHISLLIRENKNQSYAELAAAYSSNRNIPFLAGLILLETMKEAYNGVFRYYEMVRDYIVISEWSPPAVPGVPPVNHHKMHLSGHPSGAGMNDSYIMKTLREVNGNRDAAARVLKMTRPTLTARLRRMGYLLPDGSIRQDFDNWNEKMRASGRRMDKESGEMFSISFCPPSVKREIRIPLTYSDLDLRDAAASCGGDLEKASERTGLSAAVIRRRLISAGLDPSCGEGSGSGCSGKYNDADDS